MATCASDNQLIIKKLYLLNEEGLVRHSNKLDLDHCGKFFPQIITQKLQRDILVNRRGEVNVESESKYHCSKIKDMLTMTE